MRARDRKIAVLIALGGIGFCAASVIQFLLTITGNNLNWTPDLDVRAHYLAVGHSYTQGFAVGFFFCFFLAIIGGALVTWIREPAAAARPSSYPAPTVLAPGNTR